MNQKQVQNPSSKGKLIAWSLSHPTLIILVVIFFTVWGLYNYFTISRREDPEIKISTALVITVYPGAGAQKVEEQVTKKLEDAISSLENLRRINSDTRANISVITVDIDYNADADMAWQKLRTLIAQVSDDLPSMVSGPLVWDNFGDTTSMIVSFSGAPITDLNEYAKDFKSELGRISCVGNRNILGEQQEVVYLEGNRAKFSNYDLTPIRIKQALEMRNLNIPAGRIQTDTYQFRIEPSGAYDSVKAIEETIIDISTTTGQPVYVRDLFDVTRTTKAPPDNLMERNAQSVTGVGIVMKEGCNIVTMGQQVRDSVKNFQKRLPAGVKMDIVHDSPTQVDTLVKSFMNNLIGGVVIVVIVMALFMGLRAATISAVAIPLSVLIALCVMPYLNIDLELVSIASFIVALGMLVDNSIIVSDNVDIKIKEGLLPKQAALVGTSELTSPVIIGTLGTVAAFLPMLLMHGEIGAYTRGLPLVVSISLVASLLISQTLTPIMAASMLGKQKKKQKDILKTLGARFYKKMMIICFKIKWVVALLAILSFVGAVFLFIAVGFSFFPDAHRDQFTVDIWLKEGSSIKETKRIANMVDQKLLEDPDVLNTVSYIGEAGPRFYITIMPEFQKSNYAQIMVNTKDPNVTTKIIDKFNEHASLAYPGARVFAKKMVMGMPIKAPVEFRISGRDIEVLRSIGNKIKSILKDIPGADQIGDDFGPDVSSLEIIIDEERANRVGITNTDVALAFLSSHEGFELTKFNDGELEIPVIMRFSEQERSIEADLLSLPVASNITGQKVPLASIASIEPKWGPGVILRRNNQRTLTVQAWNNQRLPEQIINEAWPIISQIDLPQGYSVEIGGEKEEMDKAFFDLIKVFGVIIVLLILLLVLQTNTLRRASVVLITIPLSAVGASIGLYIGGYSFSFMAFLGIISLAGMAIKNSVVWIEYVEQRRAEGLKTDESIILAGIYRLRPILLTSVTTIGGLLPLALFGGVLFEPMAYAMIGGLFLVTLYTLVVIPVFYKIIMPDEA